MNSSRVVVFSALIVLCTAFCASADELNVSLVFSRDSVKVSKMDEYDVVALDGCELFGEPGEPLLPSKAVYVALPPGFDVDKVDVLVNAQVNLPGEFNIAPAQPAIPISRPDLYEFVEPDRAVYSLDTKVPSSLVEETGEGSLRGYRLMGLIVYPMQYIPSERKLFLSTEMTVRVTGEQAPVPLASTTECSNKGDASAKALVTSMVQNPDAAIMAPRPAPLAYRPAVDALLIAPPYYVEIAESLRAWLHRKGYKAETVSVEWIESEYEGVDLPEKIRNCIKDYYWWRGLGWVVLCGDVEQVPTRVAFAYICGDEYDREDQLQCDYYYSDLTGSWNEDGDEYWGEYLEDDVDMYPDVFVGRLPAESTQDMRLAVEKLLLYEGVGDEGLPSDYLTKFMFWGCKLDNRPTWGGDAKDKVTESTIMPNWLEFTTCYDRDGTSGKEAILDTMDEGFGIINNCGHSTYNAASALYDCPEDEREYILRGDLSNLRNAPKYSILYSIGCMFGALDWDSLAARFVNASRGGGVAAVANSRYGWYSSGSAGNGPSDLMDIAFFKAIFEDGKHNIGEAVASMKTRYVSYSKRSNRGWYGCFRWITYSMNLFGTPTMPIWTATPASIVVEHPSIYRSNREGFVVTVSDKQGEPLSGALVCLTDGAQAHGTATTDENGEAMMGPIRLSSDCKLELTVTKANFTPRTKKVTGVLNTDPELSDGEVNPGYGRAGDEFTFRVRYQDEDGDAPVVIKAKVGDEYHELSLLEGEPADGIYGATLGIAEGGCEGGEFHFVAADGRGAFKRFPDLGRITGPGIDEEAPSSWADTGPYSSSATIAVSYAAGDDCSGVQGVALWYRLNGSSWEDSGLLGQGDSGTIQFNAQQEGIYDFFTVAVDQAGNVQTSAPHVDTTCTFDETPPVSAAELGSFSGSYSQTISCEAFDSLSGVDRVQLYYRFLGPDGQALTSGTVPDWVAASATGWVQGVSFSFDAVYGPGVYEFITRATDRAGNLEREKDDADAACVFDFEPVLLTIRTDRESYRQEDEITLSAAYLNLGERVVVDLYVVLSFPDYEELFIPYYASAPAPFVSGIELPASSSGEAELHRMAIPLHFEPGPYRFWAVFTRSGTQQPVGRIAITEWELLE